MFLDDAVIIDVDLPRRLEKAADVWDQRCDSVLGKGSVSETKTNIERDWEQEESLLGFHVDVETSRIRLPEANIEGAGGAILKPSPNAGNTVDLLRTIQEFRGLFTHYTNCNALCGTFDHPTGALLAYPGEAALWVRFGDAEFRGAFWNMITFPRDTAPSARTKNVGAKPPRPAPGFGSVKRAYRSRESVLVITRCNFD